MLLTSDHRLLPRNTQGRDGADALTLSREAQGCSGKAWSGQPVCCTMLVMPAGLPCVAATAVLAQEAQQQEQGEQKQQGGERPLSCCDSSAEALSHPQPRRASPPSCPRLSSSRLPRLWPWQLVHCNSRLKAATSCAALCCSSKPSASVGASPAPSILCPALPGNPRQHIHLSSCSEGAVSRAALEARQQRREHTHTRKRRHSGSREHTHLSADPARISASHAACASHAT